jgi:hypothetical protein
MYLIIPVPELDRQLPNSICSVMLGICYESLRVVSPMLLQILPRYVTSETNHSDKTLLIARCCTSSAEISTAISPAIIFFEIISLLIESWSMYHGQIQET